ncbi:MAG TPA: methyltransferase domain-containing protein [Dehalococcoidia bacterium]|jgi:SAM-dependent methyltransferase
MTDSSIVAQGYDAVYEAMPRSPTLLRIWKEKVAGDEYPDDFSHISFLTLADLRKLGEALSLSKDSAFADLACGMGGPGIWIARETGACLTGVDFSRVGITQAEKRANTLGIPAKFSVGSFADTGLDVASMDAAMTVDALQYAPDKTAAIKEFARIIRPGGTLAFVAFELHPERSIGLPVIGEDRVSDYRPILEENGFKVVGYEQTHGWHERLTVAYGAVIDAEEALKQEMGPLASAAMLSEMRLTLERDLYTGRVFAVAQRK